MRKLLKTICVLLSFVLFLFLLAIDLPTLKVNAAGTVDDFIGRCYQVTLGRDADSDGYAYWRDILVNRKQDGSVVAHGFLFSPEYIDKATSNEQYVKDLYMLFMGREPEQSGYDYWCEKMANGESREQIFAGFANSKEYFDLCFGYGITAGYYSADYGIQQVNGVNLFVERMYQTSLDRLGDQGGQNDWVQALLEGRISGIECARSFVQSPEFINKELSDEEFLKSLYKAFMGREYDQDGLDYWLENMNNGYTRDEVFAGFANSPEFEGICAFYGIIRGNYVAVDIGDHITRTALKVGDIVKFGKYEQDGNLDNGKEDIEWEVLSLEDGKILVISKYALDVVPYNIYADCDWEGCFLRGWLNDDFYNTAFSDNEKMKIPSVTLSNEPNPYYGTPGGNDTNDKLFCLSLKELDKYFLGNNAYEYLGKGATGCNQKLICTPTQYVINNLDNNYYYTFTEYDYERLNDFPDYRASDIIGRCACNWWLRSPGSESHFFCIVLPDGSFGANYFNYMYKMFAVRPAMYIMIK